MTALERYGPPGARPGSGGRVLSGLAGKTPPLSLLETLRAVEELLEQGSLDAVVRAAELAGQISQRILLPPGTWCMVARYYSDPEAEPERFDEKIWTAHYTQELARSWTAAYNAHFHAYYRKNSWSARRRFTAERRDDAQAVDLMRAEIDPAVHVKLVHG